MLNKLPIKYRMLLILVGILILFIIMSLFTLNISGQIKELGVYEIGHAMLNGQKEKIKVATHAMAIAVSEAITSDTSSSEDDKITLIRKMLDPARFETDDSDYFFVYRNTTNIAMPVDHALQGKDLSGTKDKNDVYVIRELHRAAVSGGDFVNYIWPKPPSNNDTPKVSYAEMIPGTDMWIGTGVYIDNVEKAKQSLADELGSLARKKTISMMLIAGIIFLIIIILNIVIVIGISSGLRNLIISFRDVAEGEGDLTKRIEIKSKDELGELGGLFNTFLTKLQAMIKQIAQNSETISNNSATLTEISLDLRSNTEDTTQRATNVATASEEMNANLHSVAKCDGTIRHQCRHGCLRCRRDELHHQ